MPRFEVKINREIESYALVTVEARDEQEAEVLALIEVRSAYFTQTIRHEYTGRITEIP